MLMRYAEVLPDGTFKEASAQAKQLGYGSMLLTRVSIAVSGGIRLAEATTIATRYSLVRRQFSPDGGKEEMKIMDYQQQAVRILPTYGAIYSILLGTFELRELYADVQARIGKGEVPSDELKQIHVLSSGLKAINTWRVARWIDVLKAACGGNGYLLISGLAYDHKMQDANVTLEGDNTVMMQQVARFVVNQWALARSGKQTMRSARFFEEKSIAAVSHWKGFESIVPALKARAYNKISETCRALFSRPDREEAWNGELQSELVESAVYFCEAFQFEAAAKHLEAQKISEESKTLLRALIETFALYFIL